LHLIDLPVQLLVLSRSPAKLAEIPEQAAYPISEARCALLHWLDNGVGDRASLLLFGGVIASVIGHQSEIQQQQPKQPPGGALANLSLSANGGHWFIANCQLLIADLFQSQIGNRKSAMCFRFRSSNYCPTLLA